MKDREPTPLLDRRVTRRAAVVGIPVTLAGIGLAIAACDEGAKESEIARQRGKIPEKPATPIKPEASPAPESELRLLWQEGFVRGKFSWLDRGSLAPFSIGSDGIFLTNSDGKFTKLNLETGKPSWPVPWENAGTPLIESAGVIAVARHDLDRFYGLDSKTGTEVWKYKAEGRLDRTPIIFDHLIYSIDRRGSVEIGESFFKVEEIDPVTGKIETKLQWPPQYGQSDIEMYSVEYYASYGDFANVSNKYIILHGGTLSPLLILNRNTGEIINPVNIGGCGGQYHLSMEKLVTGTTSCGPIYRLAVYDLNKEAQLIWSLDDREPSGGHGLEMVINDKILFSTGTEFEALSISDGQTIWKLPKSYLGRKIRDGLAAENLLFESPKGDGILALNVITGQIVWENDEVIAKEVLTADGEQVFVLTKEGDLVALDSKSGVRFWKLKLGTPNLVTLLTEKSLVFGRTNLFSVDRKTGEYDQPPISVGDSIVAIHQINNQLFVESSETLTVLG